MSKFDIKDRLDKIIYKSYNVVSDLIFRANIHARRLTEQNARFEKIHAGERCFILGTGPSLADLTESQLKNLQHEYLFGVNSLYKVNLSKKLVPNYYVLVDNLYWESRDSAFVDVLNAYPDRPPTFITDYRAHDIVSKISGKNPSIYLHAKKYPVSRVDNKLHRNSYAVMNVVTVSILAAMYMGFREIYLLGCDYNAFSNAGRGHCYDDKEELRGLEYNLAFYLKFYHLTTEFHYLTAAYAKNSGVKIINLTEKSLLDAYPRRNSQSVI